MVDIDWECMGLEGWNVTSILIMGNFLYMLNGAHVILIILVNCLWLQGVEHASYKQLVDLIAHLSRKQEVLPCTLTLSSPIGAANDAHQGGVEPEYVVPDRNN